MQIINKKNREQIKKVEKLKNNIQKIIQLNQVNSDYAYLAYQNNTIIGYSAIVQKSQQKETILKKNIMQNGQMINKLGKIKINYYKDNLKLCVNFCRINQVSNFDYKYSLYQVLIFLFKRVIYYKVNLIIFCYFLYNKQKTYTFMHQEYQQSGSNFRQFKQTQEQPNQQYEQQQSQQKESVIELNPYRPQLTISEDSPNQMVTVLLEPNQSLFFKGQIVVSNRPYSNQDFFKLDQIDVDRLMHYLKHRWSMPFKLSNSGPDMAYFCIRRRGGGGKILYLEQSVYQKRFFIDMTKMLTLNIDLLDIQFINLTKYPTLSKLKLKQTNTTPLVLTLQSFPNNAIYEKSLGQSQKLFIGTSNIIAMSQQVTLIKNQNKNNQIILLGPGIVFLEAPASVNQNLQSQGQVNMFTLVVLILVLSGILINLY